MDVILDFIISSLGLDVTFKNHSTGVPDGSTYHWDFGDGSPASQDKNPTHTYTELGVYTVELKLENPASEVLGTIIREIAITNKVKTTLPGSIYDLVEEYIPTEIFGAMPYSKRQLYIQKWQLYLGPIVSHCIPDGEFTNELYYEALENQLVMELAAYDWLTVRVAEMLQANTQAIIENSLITSTTTSTSETTTATGEVKKIVTGPTEVEYFNQTESDSESASMITKAMAPGGIVDLLKQKLCMLAERLSIYLPICRQTDYHRVIPRVVNRRDKRGLKGPDPKYLVKK